LANVWRHVGNVVSFRTIVADNFRTAMFTKWHGITSDWEVVKMADVLEQGGVGSMRSGQWSVQKFIVNVLHPRPSFRCQKPSKLSTFYFRTEAVAGRLVYSTTSGSEAAFE
jgi:hypothetical protein